MDSERGGENSRKARNMDGDGNRPYKKAKYVWQLKGKYHLKGSRASVNVESVSSGRPKENSESESDGEGRVHANAKCCLDDMVYKSNALLDKFESIDDLPNIAKSISDEIPITLVKDSNAKYDEYLLKLQARQVAKSFLDNTINTILEHRKWAPFDATDLVEDCENDGQVEDEGIMMAIQSHGLQSGNMLGQAGCFECHENSQPAPERKEPEPLEDFDFLNAAVSVAIQKKGLSSYNYG